VRWDRAVAQQLELTGAAVLSGMMQPSRPSARWSVQISRPHL